MEMDADLLTADLHLSLLSPNPISQPHASSVANLSLHPPVLFVPSPADQADLLFQPLFLHLILLSNPPAAAGTS